MPDDGLVLTRVEAGATEVWQLSWTPLQARLVARLANTVRARCRELSRGRLGVGDEHGRLLELDLEL